MDATPLCAATPLFTRPSRSSPAGVDARRVCPSAPRPSSRWPTAAAILVGAFCLLRRPAPTSSTSQLASVSSFFGPAATEESEIIYLLDAATSTGASVVCSGLEYAQCYTGFCTKSGDGITASCGCLSMRPSDSVYEAELSLGWASAVLAGSTIYQDALREYVAGNTTAAADALCDALRDGTLYSSAANLSMSASVARVSLYSKYDLFGDDAGEKETECQAFSSAQCMGAPCVAAEYDSVWNLTCACPYTDAKTGDAVLNFPDVCEAAAQGGDCAAVGVGATTTEYNHAQLEAIVRAVEAWTPEVNATECETYRTSATTDDQGPAR